MVKQLTQKTAIAVLSSKRGKKKGNKNSSLKKGASSGSAPVSGNAQPSYSVSLPISTTALPPGAGPPMSSGPTGGGASVSRRSSSRAKRGRRGK